MCRWVVARIIPSVECKQRQPRQILTELTFADMSRLNHSASVFSLKMAVCTLCRQRPSIARCFWSDNGHKNIFYCIVFSLLCCWVMQPCVDRPHILSVLDMWEKYTTKCCHLVVFCCCILVVHRKYIEPSVVAILKHCSYFAKQYFNSVHTAK